MKNISIITINFNNYNGLLNTCDSVKKQTLKPLEHIIIDGASTDGSKEYLNINSDNFSTVISEPDNGIFDAMNKGIKCSTGKYLLFLNSGDFFINDNELEYIENLIDNNPGYYNYFFGIKRGNRNKIIPVNKTLKDFIWIGDTAPHQSTIISRDLFRKIGLYNKWYKVAGDMEFFARSLYYGCNKNFYSDRVIVEMQPGGVGSYDSVRSLFEKFILHLLYVRNKKILLRLLRSIFVSSSATLRSLFCWNKK